MVYFIFPLSQIEEKMEIILLKNVEKVGRKFDIVTVKNGYGRNYLIPQGLALLANKQNRNNLDGYKRREAAKLEKMLDHFQDIANIIKGKVLNIPVKCGTSGRIFGSVTTIQIAKMLKEQMDVEVDRRDIILPDNIKEIGSYSATLDLHPDIDSKIDFVVEPDDPKIAAIIAENRAQEAEEAAKLEAERAERAAAYAASVAEEAAAEAGKTAPPPAASEEEE